MNIDAEPKQIVLMLIIVLFLLATVPTGTSHIVGAILGIVVLPIYGLYKLAVGVKNGVNNLMSSEKPKKDINVATYDYEDVRSDVRRFKF